MTLSSILHPAVDFIGGLFQAMRNRKHQGKLSALYSEMIATQAIPKDVVAKKVNDTTPNVLVNIAKEIAKRFVMPLIKFAVERSIPVIASLVEGSKHQTIVGDADCEVIVTKDESELSFPVSREVVVLPSNQELDTTCAAMGISRAVSKESVFVGLGCLLICLALFNGAILKDDARLYLAMLYSFSQYNRNMIISGAAIVTKLTALFGVSATDVAAGWSTGCGAGCSTL